MNVYVPGQTVIIGVAFANPTTLVPQAATTLKARILTPAGLEIDIITGFGNPSPGVYTWAIVTAIPEVGLWNYRWEATTPFTAAAEGTFYVAPTPFVPD
jgi:hypothetical protein